jgi:HlyD family secretion protein
MNTAPALTKGPVVPKTLDLGAGAPPSAKAPDIEAILGVGKRAPSHLLRWRNLLWAVAAVAVIAAIYGLWSLGGTRTPVRYLTEPAARGSLTVVVTATGSAQPITQVNVSSELSGTIRKVFVDYNSPVTAGQALAELDTDKLEATVQNSRAKLTSARAKVEDAAASIEEKRAEYERKKTLATTNVSSVRDLELAKANYDKAVAQNAMAVADVGVAEADLRLNEINLAKATIRSSIDGIVLKRGVDPGQFVATSLQAPVLFVIAEDLRHMEVQVDVDEADVGRVKIGQKVSFSVDAYPDRKFPAEVRDIRFGSETVQGIVTYKAVLTIDNSELLIRPGMTATAQVVVQDVADALLIPNVALRFSPPTTSQQNRGFLKSLLPSSPAFRPPSKQEETGRSQRVWVLRDGEPVAIPVAVGSTDGRRTEIVKGDISPDQPIIVDATTAKR